MLPSTPDHQQRFRYMPSVAATSPLSMAGTPRRSPSPVQDVAALAAQQRFREGDDALRGLYELASSVAAQADQRADEAERGERALASRSLDLRAKLFEANEEAWTAVEALKAEQQAHGRSKVEVASASARLAAQLVQEKARVAAGGHGSAAHSRCGGNSSTAC